MILWLLITLTAGPLVDVPDVICVHDVAGLSPSLQDIAHAAPSVSDVTHITPRLTVTHREC